MPTFIFVQIKPLVIQEFLSLSCEVFHLFEIITIDIMNIIDIDLNLCNIIN